MEPSAAGTSLAYLHSSGLRAPRVTPARAFEVARDHFRRGDRLDMAALATELGIGRATLYRWTGDRERLLADILISEFDAIAARLEERTAGAGIERIERGVASFIELIAAASAIRALLCNEGDAGLRLLTLPSSRVRRRFVQVLTAVIAEEEETGAYRPPAPAESLAEGIVVIGERFLHHGGDPDLNPDPATAIQMIHLLLRSQ
ncbi:QsdR family transcriptional regulator [Amycolatopsis nivea]|uniref:QsdR family transcriptional regulator n=1 Tax=Amycolatopsis nivea TaxID=1644109 RepID=UPI0010701898|nr:QsdR family transcriptional regulator [Amycolatopsis nivea]